MAQAYDLPEEPGMSGEFDFREHAGPVQLGPLTVEPIAVAHPVPAYGFRVSAHGRTIAYTGDTGPCEALDRIAGGADLLLAEASFREGEDNPPDLHLTGREAGEVAARNGVPRLVLTHVPPWHVPAERRAEAAEVFAGALVLAEPGASYDVE
jgi:ribonuclease BN (tRNA processing enzyme)